MTTYYLAFGTRKKDCSGTYISGPWQVFAVEDEIYKEVRIADSLGNLVEEMLYPGDNKYHKLKKWVERRRLLSQPSAAAKATAFGAYVKLQENLE